jgi:arabinose-5-phosphate isomerase
MHTGEAIPVVTDTVTLDAALNEMTQKGLGMTTIVNADQQLVGVFTDGDLRRVLDHGEINIRTILVKDVMTGNCMTGSADMLAAEALQMMERYKINALPIVDGQHRVIGAMNMHDLLRAGVM